MNEIIEKLGDSKYDDLYDHCNFIIRQVGYDGKESEKNVVRLQKDFPNIEKKILLEVLLEAHDDYHKKEPVSEHTFFCIVCNRDTLHKVTHH